MPHTSMSRVSVAASVRHGPHTRSVVFALIVAASIGTSGSAWAHHSFSMFDKTQSVTIKGTVKEFQWTNPHAWIELMVQTPTGLKQYSIEAFNVRTLRGAGWRYDTLNPGDTITVVMNPLRNGAAGGSLVNVKLADGRTLNSF